MHYKTAEMNAQAFSGVEPLDTFLKEIGMTVENLPKFTLRREDILEDQSTKVIVLEKK
jgi:hypothetical protein